MNNAIFTLILVVTGSGWNDIMEVLGKGKSETNNCIDNPEYADFVRAGEPIGCGNYLLAYPYFFTFVTFVSLVFLNLFVAIILNGYFETRE